MPSVYGPRSRSGYKSRRSAYGKFTRSNRSKAVAKARGKVKRILKKPYVPRILKNTQSVAALSRSVLKLQRQQLGLYQVARHGYSAPSNDSTFTDSRPICFPINNFDAGANIFTCDGSGADVVKGTFSNFMYPMGSSEMYNYWEGTYNDTVSDIAYLPISTQLEFHFESNMSAVQQPIWIRVDIVRQKKFLPDTTSHDLYLPNSLIGLSKMAVTKTPNQYNREYFDVLQTKWVKLDRADATHSGAMLMQKRIKMSHTFPNKLIKIDESPGTSTSDHTFHTNVQPKDMIWCVMNCSHGGVPNLNVDIVRTCRWRDQHGVAT